MTDIYTQHDAAFARVSAFVILDGQGERVATVALKYPADGAGRLYAYVHLIGVPMVRGFASGGGYDKRSAAVASAIGKIEPWKADPANPSDLNDRIAEVEENRRKFGAAWSDMHSDDWTRAIEKQGFRVLQAV